MTLKRKAIAVAITLAVIYLTAHIAPAVILYFALTQSPTEFSHTGVNQALTSLGPYITL